MQTTLGIARTARVVLVVVLAVAATLAGAGDARADACAVEAGATGTVVAMKAHPTVVLAEEELRIVFGRAKSEVRARFVFVNEGPAATVFVGFPEDEAFGWPMKGLRATVDGRRVTTRPSEPTEPDDAYGKRRFHVHEVTFAEGGRRTLEYAYETLSSDCKGEYGLDYILKTGASWKGPIGDLRIVVESGEDAHGGPLRVTLGERREPPAPRVELRLRDYEPVDDLHVSWLLPDAWTVRITADGVGPLRAGARVGEKAVRRAFPWATFERPEGAPPGLVVLCRPRGNYEQHVLTVVPDAKGRVACVRQLPFSFDGCEGAFEGPGGVRTDAPFADVLAAHRDLACTAGEGRVALRYSPQVAEWEPDAIVAWCTLAAAPNIRIAVVDSAWSRWSEDGTPTAEGPRGLPAAGTPLDGAALQRLTERIGEGDEAHARYVVGVLEWRPR